MKKFICTLITCTLCLWSSNIYAQDPLSDCEIHMDELELQLKKDKKDTKKYYHIQLEEGNTIFEKDLRAIDSNQEKRTLRKEYKTFIQGLEKDYNAEMDKLEDSFVETLEGLAEECGSRAVRRRIALFYQERNSYNSRRRRYR